MKTVIGSKIVGLWAPWRASIRSRPEDGSTAVRERDDESMASILNFKYTYTRNRIL